MKMQNQSLLYEDDDEVKWYVMRDLKRENANKPAYMELQEKKIKVFTPMKWKICHKCGKLVREKVPYLADLLFVCASKVQLDSLVSAISTLQYRYIRGGHYKEGMVVRNEDMDRFIKVVESISQPQYYQPDEISSRQIGNCVKIVGGPLDGYSGNILKIRGSRKKRLLVSIPNLITAAVEVEPQYLQVMK